jgi:pyridoxamine 5'-phosphate oxidase
LVIIIIEMNKKIIFSEETIEKKPFKQFDLWYRERLSAGIEIPDSVSLGTGSADGRISVRTVLLKEYNKNGFVFFTNYNSKKGAQLLSNPKAAMLFHWAESGRQVRVEGSVSKLTVEESDAYFSTRPRESQLGAWASNQSTVIPDRSYLEERYDFYKKTFNDKSVGKPEYWGGFRLIPEWFEFWQSGEFRLHDRISYTKNAENWIIERLAP